MSVVVDSSVLVAALVDSGTQGNWAEGILAGGSLHAPELVRVEATNVLRRLERAKQITTAEANAAHDDLMHLGLELFPFDPFADPRLGTEAHHDVLRRVVCRRRRSPASAACDPR